LGLAPISSIAPFESALITSFECTSPLQYVPQTAAFVLPSAHEGDIYALAASACASYVASGGDDRTIRVFDMTKRKTVAMLKDCVRSVTCLDFEPASGGSLLVGGSHDGFMRLWRRDEKRRKAGWTMQSAFPVHTGPVRKVMFDRSSPSSAPRIYTCSQDRSIKLTDVSGAGTKRPFVVNSPSAVLDMDVQSGGVVVSGHKDGGLRLWSCKEGDRTVAEASKTHARAITSVSCLDNGFGVVTLGRDDVLSLNDTRKLSETVREMDVGVRTVSDWHKASLDGRDVACGLGPSGTIAIWNVDSGKIERKLPAPHNHPKNIVETDAKGGVDSGSILGLLPHRPTAAPGCGVVPMWIAGGLVIAYKSRQLSFWV
jgi:WD40 repeat protein